MNTTEIIRLRTRLDNLFALYENLPDDYEIKAHWARYLCVLTSGFLEQSVKTLYRECAAKKSAPFIANFVAHRLESFQNPKMGKILDLTGNFEAKWKEELEVVTDDQIKGAVDSVVENRNKIAHGVDVGITYVRIKEYYKSVINVIDLIESLCSI